jgi:hypothetical protein
MRVERRGGTDLFFSETGLDLDGNRFDLLVQRLNNQSVLLLLLGQQQCMHLYCVQHKNAQH